MLQISEECNHCYRAAEEVLVTLNHSDEVGVMPLCNGCVNFWVRCFEDGNMWRTPIKTKRGISMLVFLRLKGDDNWMSKKEFPAEWLG